MNRKNLLWVGSVLALSVMSGQQASAQGVSDFDWSVTPYLWGAGIDGDITVGSVSRDVDISASDIVDVLAGAVMVRFEGGNADHGVFGDLVFLRLEPEDEVATVGGVASAQFDSMILDLGYVRKFGQSGLEFGVRYWDLELEIAPALIPAIKRDDSWADGYVGIRRARDLGNWNWESRINVGAGGSDFTFGLESRFARELSSGNKFVLGVKTIGIDYEKESVNGAAFKVDTKFMGGTIGFMFN